MKEALFDGYAQDYDEWFVANEKVFLSELDLLKTSLGDNPGRTLSIGSGSGLFEQALRQQTNIDVREGVEPSKDMAAIAEKRGMQVRIATAETAELPADTYDTIYFNGSSSYIVDLKFAYGNIARALKPGGRLILLDVPKESAYGMLYMLADALGGYQNQQLSGVLPTVPYPEEFLKLSNWHTTQEKAKVLTQDLGFVDVSYYQTLLANPVYTDQAVEETISGYNKGGYVAIIAHKQKN
ncbi:class I SAM-dependent DNA methyltransferase [Lentilactobacillus sunkii]|nr:class I SAM-dependent methyltransferase [Lentilactobacillus sunkii]